VSNIITYTGRLFDVLKPRPEDVDIVDIAHALANSCRWGGHCRTFFSVAQHSVLTSLHVPPEHGLWGLLHDAAEAYLVDVPRPIKHLLPAYQEMEEIIMAAVCRRFSMDSVEPLIVKEVDMRLLATEAEILGMHPHLWGAALSHPLPVVISPQPPGEAKRDFLKRFEQLTRQPLPALAPSGE
jgi:hypothetical protein